MAISILMCIELFSIIMVYLTTHFILKDKTTLMTLRQYRIIKWNIIICDFIFDFTSLLLQTYLLANLDLETKWGFGLSAFSTIANFVISSRELLMASNLYKYVERQLEIERQERERQEHERLVGINKIREDR